MTTTRLIGAVCAAGGAILLWKGWEQYDSVSSSIGRAVGSGPSNETLLMLIGGGVLVVAGILLAVRR